MRQTKPVPPPENPMEAFARQATEQGNKVLAELFGSKEVSRAVADQAAALTGIGNDVLQGDAAGDRDARLFELRQDDVEPSRRWRRWSVR